MLFLLVGGSFHPRYLSLRYELIFLLCCCGFMGWVLAYVVVGILCYRVVPIFKYLNLVLVCKNLKVLNCLVAFVPSSPSATLEKSTGGPKSK